MQFINGRITAVHRTVTENNSSPKNVIFYITLQSFEFRKVVTKMISCTPKMGALSSSERLKASLTTRYYVPGVTSLHAVSC
jgi:hypothetical protein